MLRSNQTEFQRFFQESRQPIWQSNLSRNEGSEYDRYGKLDLSAFSELEMRMYVLIKARLASKAELESVYTLDEALKLYALYQMDIDIERGRAEELQKREN